MKLSEKQKELIILMRKGYVGEFSAVNNESAYLATDTMKGKAVNITNFKKFEKMGLVTKIKKNFALYQYHLTETGKTINL